MWGKDRSGMRSGAQGCSYLDELEAVGPLLAPDADEAFCVRARIDLPV